MQVIEFLKYNSYEDLEEKYSIKCKHYDDRVILNYDQLNSPKYDPIVRECRGLILSKPDNRVLCRPFDRFYNYGEDPRSKEFNLSTATVFEKIDGSMISVYHDYNKWQAATRNMAFAEGMSNTDRTFREIFIEALGAELEEAFNMICKELTIIFELVSPETRVVKPYSKNEAYLLNCRNRETGLLFDNNITYFWPISKNVRWRYPKRYTKETFSSFDDIMDSMKNLNVMDEGYVTRQTEGSWMIKIKNPAYLAIAHMRMNGIINKDRIADIVMMGEQSEYLNYFPEDEEMFTPYINAYENMMEDISNTWYHNFNIKDKKEFALSIEKNRAKNILFGMWNGNTAREIIDKMTKQAKRRLLINYMED